VVPDEKELDTTLRFNLDIVLPNTCIRIAENTTIADIPSEGYSLNLFDINLNSVIAESSNPTKKRYGFVSFQQKDSEGKYIITIEYIYSDSPASKAGLEISDKLLKVDGKLVTDMSFDEFNQALDNKDSITLVFVHANSDVENTVIMNKEIVR